MAAAAWRKRRTRAPASMAPTRVGSGEKGRQRGGEGERGRQGCVTSSAAGEIEGRRRRRRRRAREGECGGGDEQARGEGSGGEGSEARVGRAACWGEG
jgi:hypothetical protein